MKKYRVKMIYSGVIEAENRNEAVNKAFEISRKEQLYQAEEYTAEKQRRAIFLDKFDHFVFQDIYKQATTSQRMYIDSLSTDELKQFVADNKQEFDHYLSLDWKALISERLSRIIDQPEDERV